jgi:hypothetical protein
MSGYQLKKGNDTMPTPEWLPKAIELYEKDMPYYKIGE